MWTNEFFDSLCVVVLSPRCKILRRGKLWQKKRREKFTFTQENGREEDLRQSNGRRRLIFVRRHCEKIHRVAQEEDQIRRRRTNLADSRQKWISKWKVFWKSRLIWKNLNGKNLTRCCAEIWHNSLQKNFVQSDFCRKILQNYRHTILQNKTLKKICIIWIM